MYPLPRTGVRYGNVDITRFLACLAIVDFHLYILGYPQSKGWAWVDYFFILSGYFTMSHFQKQKDYKECGMAAMTYTFRKFSGYLPYVIVAELLRYGIDAFPLVQSHAYKDAIKGFFPMPFEILFFIGAFFPRLGPVWYLSTMFFTLPLLIIAIYKWRDIWPAFSFLLPVLYYGRYGMNTIRDWPHDLVRAFACLTLGTGLYYIIKLIRTREWSRFERFILTVLEIFLLLASMYITIYGMGFHHLLIFFFPMLIVLQISGCTYSAYIHGSFCGFLGKISLLIYLFYLDVALLIIKTGLSQGQKTFCVYAGTILLSILMLFLVEYIKKTNVYAQCISRIRAEK